jgi:sulfoxide reductase catalytic subunit YedY
MGRSLDHVIIPAQEQLFIWATGGSASNSYWPGAESELNPWTGPKIRYHGPEMGVNHGEIHLTLNTRNHSCPLLPGGSSAALSPCSSNFQFVDGFDERYSSSATLFGNKVRVFWQYNQENGDVRFGVRSLQSAKCVAIGFGKNMVGSSTFVGWNSEEEGSNVYAYKMTSQKANGFEELLATEDIDDATVFETTLPDGGSALSFEFKMSGATAKDTFGLDLMASPTVNFIWSYGNSWRVDPIEADLHTDRSSSATTVDLSTGSASHNVGASASFIAHGVLMFVAWGVIVPVILVAARYVRVLPKSSFLGKLWIKTHKYAAYAATILALVGSIVTTVHLDDLGSLHLQSTHSQLGVACMVFLGVQIGLGIFRPPPNKPRPAATSVRESTVVEMTSISGPPIVAPKDDSAVVDATEMGVGTLGVSGGGAAAIAATNPAPEPAMDEFKYMVRVAWEKAHRIFAVAAFALAIASLFSGLDEIVLKGDTQEGSDRRYAILVAWLCILAAVSIVLELTRNKIVGGNDGVKDNAELLMKQLLALCSVSLLGLVLWDRLAENAAPDVDDGCSLQALMFADESLASEPVPSAGDATVPEDGTGTTPDVPPEFYTDIDDEIAATYPDCAGFPLRYVGDGWCDGHTPYNTEACGWDGGDCCDPTVPLYNCEDPESPNFGESAPKGAIYPAPHSPRYDVGSRAHSTEDVVTSYNNFYEFGYTKNIKAEAQKQTAFFEDPDWEIEITGLIANPMTVNVWDLIDMMHLEERLYRHRCVEAWSIVQPVTGFPLTKLLDLVQPLESAKYVKMQTFLDLDVSIVQKGDPRWPWPYTESITMDEARNELAFMTTGVFGKKLPPQNGAPIRLQLPWKYGFKSVKSIKKIEFVEARPLTFWAEVNGGEYGFWANINPAVSHPRWSQARERELIDSSFSYNYRETVIYNGYETEVAYLYDKAELQSEALYMR